MTLRADSNRLAEVLGELVSTNSINPAFGEGAPGETAIAGVTAHHMSIAGLAVATHEAEPGRPSVVGRLPGTGGGPSLMLNAHYDTVGVEGMNNPFVPRVAGGRLYGRGAFDMKGALASCIEAGRLLAEQAPRLKGDVLVAGVADEEYASIGTADLLARRDRGELKFDAAVVTEPTSLKLCIAHRGFTWIEIATRGRAVHGSRYRDGVDANLMMGRVLGRLEALGARLQSRQGHPLLGPPSLHAALVKGGTGISTYSARCELKLERRTVPPETRQLVEDEVSAILDDLRREDSSFDAVRSTLLHREPFETSAGAPIASSVARAAAKVLAAEAAVTGEHPWMDSALLQADGVDTVVFGPSGAGAHADEEWVDIESCARLAEVLAEAALDFCG